MRATLTFLGQIVTHWRTTGAIAPSGARLAKAMALSVGPVRQGEVIIELGPGTGVFTRELLRRFPHAKIVVIEFNTVFAKHLRERMPQVDVVEGCASKMQDHLRELGIERSRVVAVVSGLPLLVMPRELTNAIMGAITDVLPEGRRYVQFTYSRKAWARFMPSGFSAERHRKVWLNMPPAVVLPFVRRAG